MINSEQPSASPTTGLAPAANNHSTSDACHWLSHTTNCVYNALRHIPNPAHLLFSAPGQAITLLALASRGISGADAYPDTSAMASAIDPEPFSAALPDLPPPSEPAWMAALNDLHDLDSFDPHSDQESSGHDGNNDGNIVSRQKREPRGGSVGGGRGGSSGRGGGGRSSSGRGRGFGGSSSRGHANSKATGRYFSSGSRVGKEYVTKTKTYFTGKELYNVHGRQVNLYKNLMFDKTGKLKKQITTANGVKYNIKQSKGWLTVKTNNHFTISTIPKVRSQRILGTMFRLSLFNFYLSHLWNTPVEVHYLFRNSESRKLLFVPDPVDSSKVNIGYYQTSADELPTANNTTMTAYTGNHTTTASPAGHNVTTTSPPPDKQFITIATAPKGSSISLALLNNPEAKPSVTTSSNVTTTASPVTPTNGTQLPSSTEPLPTPAPPTELPSNTTDIQVSNNVTRLNSLIPRGNIATDVASQLVIMNGDDVLGTMPLAHKVEKFLVNSNNDTFLTFAMNEPKTVENRFVEWWWSYSNIAVAANKPGYLLVPLLAAGALKNNYS